MHNLRDIVTFFSEALHAILLTCRGPCPPEFLCPISYEIMVNPVVCSDGHTYDHVNISRWFQTSNRSPLTNVPLDDTTLRPNNALKTLIESFKLRKLHVDI